MDASIVVAGIALTASVITAAWKYFEGRKNDETLRDVESVKLSHSALKDTITTLVSEVNRYKLAAAEAHAEALEARKEAATMLDQYLAMRDALGGMRAAVAEHELTIAALRREVDRLRFLASPETPADLIVPPTTPPILSTPAEPLPKDTDPR